MDLSFAAPGLLWALPLAAAPVLLHIRARARERAVDFPGAFFMQDPAMPSAERRRKVEDWALLALRCLLLALAVAALAGPRIKGFPWLTAQQNEQAAGREAVVLAVDDSPSFAQRKGAGGVSALERLLQAAGEALARGRGRRVAVETSSGRSLPFYEAAEFPAHIHELAEDPASRPGDRAAALGRAMARLRDVTEDRRVAILVSDERMNAEEGGGEKLDARWSAALNAFQEKNAPVLMVLSAASSAAKQWSVESIAPGFAALPGTAARAPVAGQPYSVRVRVRCHAGAGTRTLRVETAAVSSDAPASPAPRQVKTVLERSVALDAGEAADIDIPALAPAPGFFWFRARLDGDDELAFDNAAETVVRVQPRREVVLWDLREGSGGRGIEDLPRKALVSALDPFAGDDRTRVHLLQPAAPRVDELPAQAIVVALQSVQAGAGSVTSVLGHGPAERLYGLVQEGVKLLWVPDLTGKPEAWAGAVGRKIASDTLLPRGIERVEAAPKPENAAAVPGWKLGLADGKHPLLAPFAGGRNGDLAGVRFLRRLRLDIETATARLPGAWENEQVLGRFDDGLPAIVFQRVGAGALGQLAFGPEPKGGITESAAWPIFFQEFIEWSADDGLGADPGPVLAAASTPDPWPVTPRGKARRFALEGPLPMTPAPDAKEKGKPKEPGRWELAVSALGDRLSLPVLSQPGLYRITQLDIPSRPPQRWIACRVAECESSDERLPKALLEKFAQAAQDSGGATVSFNAGDPNGSSRGTEALDRALEHLRPGRPVAPALWTIFAAFMLLELGILIVRKRTG